MNSRSLQSVSRARNTHHALRITHQVLLLTVHVLLLVPTATAAPRYSTLVRDFQHPPDSARPWVFWFWLNGNVTSNGLTADLEAMKRAGIGGVAIMDVDQGVPKGPIEFGSATWIALF